VAVNPTIISGQCSLSLDLCYADWDSDPNTAESFVTGLTYNDCLNGVGQCSGADTTSTTEADCLDANTNGGAGLWTASTSVGTWTQVVRDMDDCLTLGGTWTSIPVKLGTARRGHRTAGPQSAAYKTPFPSNTAQGTCSDANYTSQSDCLSNNGTWTWNGGTCTGVDTVSTNIVDCLDANTNGGSGTWTWDQNTAYYYPSNGLF
jgi:hypothetical protein